jgi:NitT/TauT family transport system permease protein
VLVALWQIVFLAELFNPLILPGPSAVAGETVDIVANILRGGHIREEWWLTTQESFLAFAVAGVSGILLGILVAETSFGRHVAMPFVVAINAAPKVAFGPLFVAWFGFGILPKLLLGAFIAFFPLLIDTATGLATTHRDQLRLFRSLRANRREVLLRLKLPAAAPFIFSGLKTASVLSVVGAIVGEFVGGGGGMGGLLKIQANQLQTARLLALVFILSVLGYVFYAAVAWVEKRVVFWHTGHGDVLLPHETG